ncbi:hypothetical protein CNE_BB1p08310 (plasmid) [Cupriavidus necator N-1]|uniref:Uncharacterized protein n=1 Tax=Cupriavidus necator (strain ATCC 43291 / DSM 13513 / CCUG 52238 / LMG 8453 / N-1) TaxID=1042878 RepID=F8GU41_CUPNN|nr:hypothetical protein CNE_BB1p08310 [Cupriavidus necator N-1]
MPNRSSYARKLVALAHAGLKAWAKVGNLQFPPEKRYAVLQEIVRYCAEECLLACCFTQADRLGRIADGWTPPTFATPALAQDSPRAATVMGGRSFAPLFASDIHRAAVAGVWNGVNSVYNSGHDANSLWFSNQQANAGVPGLAGSRSGRR